MAVVSEMVAREVLQCAVESGFWQSAEQWTAAWQLAAGRWW